MSRFTKLTDPSTAKPVYVRGDLIASIHEQLMNVYDSAESDECEERYGSQITFNGSSCTLVAETPDEILELLNSQ